MATKSIERLNYLCNTIPELLLEIDEDIFSAKPNPEKWSKKEIIGHLIDSATNNHQRFVRGQFEEIPTTIYDQNKWNECSYYQLMNSRQLITFRTVYNKQLVEFIQHIPEDKLIRRVDI